MRQGYCRYCLQSEHYGRHLMNKFIPHLDDALTLADAIVNTIPEPFLVLDPQFHVLMASRVFCNTFGFDGDMIRGQLLFTLGDHQWDIPALRSLLEKIIPQRMAMDGFEVDHAFPGLGRRMFLLNARKVRYASGSNVTILLAFSDITVRREAERAQAQFLEQTEELLRQKEILLQEMEHRVANSLQIIASILMLKANVVTSEETRSHLRDAHQRVLSVAAVQSHLHAANSIDSVRIGPYLTSLCASLAASMIDEQHIVITVTADLGELASAKAVSIGLIVTELVINAIKHAFPSNRPGGTVTVNYESMQPGWRLIVADNGTGRKDDATNSAPEGLGTVIVKALVKQLGARMETKSAPTGLTVSIACPAVSAKLPKAA